ncbi:MAG: hypothetical protein AAF639_46980 [Chloroflexota bacterium]
MAVLTTQGTNGTSDRFDVRTLQRWEEAAAHYAEGSEERRHVQEQIEEDGLFDAENEDRLAVCRRTPTLI